LKFSDLYLRYLYKKASGTPVSGVRMCRIAEQDNRLDQNVVKNGIYFKKLIFHGSR